MDESKTAGDVDGPPDNRRPSIEVSHAAIAWDLDAGSVSFFGIPSALFWTDPSLLRMLAPLAEEVGHEQFRLMVAESSSIGTEEDYHVIVTSLGATFSEGFLAWGEVVGAAGWGHFELPAYDLAKQSARVVVRNPWELSMQRSLRPEERWGCPFLQGKIIGIFTHALETRCWADEELRYDDDGNGTLILTVYASERTISKELAGLRTARRLSRERRLEREIQQKTVALEQAQEELRQYSRSLEQRVKARTRALLAETNRAEAALAAQSNFLATMSHELRTPMNGVLGLTQLLSVTPLDAVQKRYIDALEASGETLLGLINHTLDFSKIEAGRMVLDRQPFDLVSCLDAVQQTMTPIAHKRGLRLTVVIIDDTPLDLVGDRLRLTQVLVNLVGNAIKFTEHGEVRLLVRGELGPSGEGKFRFEVVDTGRGVAVETLSKVFVPFVQGDARDGSRHGGTGLGLAISRRLVEAMGGEIGAESVLDHGSTFWFTAAFDLHRSVARTAPPIAEAIVVAPLSDAFLPWKLRTEGLRVTAAASVEEAWALVAEREADLLFVDLPRVDLPRVDLPRVDLPRVDLPADDHPTLDEARLASLAAWSLPAGVTVVALVDQDVGSSSSLPERTEVLAQPPSLKSLRRLLLGLQLGVGGLRVPDGDNGPGPQLFEPGRAVRVLLVEDNVINQVVAQTMLEQLGAHVRFAINGQEALDAVRAEEWDLALMDCEMPVMNGFTATREIRRLERGTERHLPIIALTANALDDQRDACLAAGMDAHIAKPVARSDLAALLQRHARRRPGSSG